MNDTPMPEGRRIDAPYPPMLVETVHGKYIINNTEWIPVEDNYTFKDAMNTWNVARPGVVYSPATLTTKISVQSATDPTKKYEVGYSDETGWTCTCPSYIFGTPTPKTCKHIRSVQLMGDTQ